MQKLNFDAVIFDLDGVITKTATVHSTAWKKMFDEYLKNRESKHNEIFKEFSLQDYLSYVDGKPRYEGVKSFLGSRGIDIPFGSFEDSTEQETICGLGNRKNDAFNEVLEKEGVESYESTVNLMKELASHNIRIGVASSSKNCLKILQSASLIGMIETRVDGVVSVELGLKGKPNPDIFTRAADNLGVTYDRTVVVEDAVSGVAAGKKGNFGLILGLARENNHKELKQNGADIVVSDISEISLDEINEWFEDGLVEDSWSICYNDYDPAREKSRESLLTIGNGYFGTRGAMEEICAGNHNYPGTYIAGVYNRLTSIVGDREIENEDLVNCPNWTHIRFKIEDDEWLNVNNSEIINIQRKLDFRNGLLYRILILRDKKQRETQIESYRLASINSPHLAGMWYSVTPLNYSANITIQSGIDGNIINEGVERYKQLNQNHLKSVKQYFKNGELNLITETSQSEIQIKIKAKHLLVSESDPDLVNVHDILEEKQIYQEFTSFLKMDKSFEIEKLVSIQTSIDQDGKNKELTLKDIYHFGELLHKNISDWQNIWKEIDINIEGDRLSQKLFRMHLFHLIVTVSENNINIDAGIPARGLHGEAYRGHIFWDELYILPFYFIHYPEVAKSILLYRYRRLDKAKEYAMKFGYDGAMYPWQSGSDGREETQVVHLNPLTGEWGADFSSLQRHVSLAIAYNIISYFNITNDKDFITSCGIKMLVEIIRMWVSKSIYNEESDKYSITEVMGPDEFHEKYKGSEKGGLADNAYTNIMLAWCIEKTNDILDMISPEDKDSLLSKLDLSSKEIERFSDVAKKLKLVISDESIISQFDGYFDLKELDWDAYRNKYTNIYRMDRILKSENRSADDYKVAKQADTLMTFYNLDKEEVDKILHRLNYKLPESYLEKNLGYYLARTSHGSTLSRVVHAQLANMIDDKRLSWELYSQALSSDFIDLQGGTTGEGIHTGVMAGTIMVALFSYAGVNLKHDIPRISPQLPKHWRKLSFSFHFRGIKFYCEVFQDKVNISFTGKEKTSIFINQKEVILHEGQGKKIIL